MQWNIENIILITIKYLQINKISISVNIFVIMYIFRTIVLTFDTMFITTFRL